MTKIKGWDKIKLKYDVMYKSQDGMIIQLEKKKENEWWLYVEGIKYDFFETKIKGLNYMKKFMLARPRGSLEDTKAKRMKKAIQKAIQASYSRG